MSANKTYHLKIQVLTPTFIGSNREDTLKNGVDYFKENERYFIVDWQRLFERSNENQLYDLKEYLLDNKSEELKTFVRQLQAAKPAAGELTGDVKMHVKNNLNGRLIIPGSSLKGAIRSVLVHFLFQASGMNRNDYIGKKKKNTEFLELLFGSLKDGENFMRFLQVSDAEFDTEQAFVRSKVFSLSFNRQERRILGGWKSARHGSEPEFNERGFVTTYEVLPMDSNASFRLNFSEKGWENASKQIKKWFDQETINRQIQQLENELASMQENDSRRFNVQKKLKKLRKRLRVLEVFKNIVQNENFTQALFEKINEFALQYAEKEIAFHEKFQQAEHSKKLIAAWQQIKKITEEAIKSGNQYAVLRLGQGSGFHNVTGDWQFDTHHITFAGKRGAYRGKNSAKTRKWAFEKKGNNFVFYPMGFVLIGDIPENLKNPFHSKYGTLSVYEPNQKKEVSFEPKSIDQLKQGNKITGEVVDAKFGKIYVKIHVKEIQDDVFEIRYNSGLEKGTKVLLKINQISGGKKGKPKKIMQLGFEKIL